MVHIIAIVLYKSRGSYKGLSRVGYSRPGQSVDRQQFGGRSKIFLIQKSVSKLSGAPCYLTICTQIGANFTGERSKLCFKTIITPGGATNYEPW